MKKKYFSAFLKLKLKNIPYIPTPPYKSLQKRGAIPTRPYIILITYY